METIFVIGMFKSQSRRFSAECTRREIRCRQVLADVGRQGILGLVPTPGDAVLAFRDWLKTENEDYENLYIVLLPYCDITDELYDELDVAVECGATLIEPEAGIDGWPDCLPRKKKPDEAFLNTFFRQMTLLLPTMVEHAVSVSEHYRRIAAENPRIIFSPHVYECCDAVALYRKSFMKDAVNALLALLTQPPDCRIDAFFRSKGIDHAQTGGISTYLEVTSSGSSIKYPSQMHLKKGDKTSIAAAVRIYYHFIQLDDISYIVVMYAGPHPERDISWQLRLPIV